MLSEASGGGATDLWQHIRGMEGEMQCQGDRWDKLESVVRKVEGVMDALLLSRGIGEKTAQPFERCGGGGEDECHHIQREGHDIQVLEEVRQLRCDIGEQQTQMQHLITVSGNLRTAVADIRSDLESVEVRQAEGLQAIISDLDAAQRTLQSKAEGLQEAATKPVAMDGSGARPDSWLVNDLDSAFAHLRKDLQEQRESQLLDWDTALQEHRSQIDQLLERKADVAEIHRIASELRGCRMDVAVGAKHLGELSRTELPSSTWHVPCQTPPTELARPEQPRWPDSVQRQESARLVHRQDSASVVFRQDSAGFLQRQSSVSMGVLSPRDTQSHSQSQPQMLQQAQQQQQQEEQQQQQQLQALRRDISPPRVVQQKSQPLLSPQISSSPSEKATILTAVAAARPHSCAPSLFATTSARLPGHQDPIQALGLATPRGVPISVSPALAAASYAAAASVSASSASSSAHSLRPKGFGCLLATCPAGLSPCSAAEENSAPPRRPVQPLFSMNIGLSLPSSQNRALQPPPAVASSPLLGSPRATTPHSSPRLLRSLASTRSTRSSF